MAGDLTGRALRVVTFALIVLIVAVGAKTAYPTWKREQSLKAQEVELREQIQEKNRQIAQLRENQRRFREDPDFVEAIARRNRRVFPGELIFIFED